MVAVELVAVELVAVELEIGTVELVAGTELVMVAYSESYDDAVPSETVSVRITVLVELT